ncbi:MAG TPA: aminopeptidase P N-terminal domain-containing protein [Acidobacteriota bacterium]|nr:aminopeptidase P N-terminal domain-containing protein [Acidobacteriota bacterium]
MGFAINRAHFSRTFLKSHHIRWVGFGAWCALFLFSNWVPIPTVSAEGPLAPVRMLVNQPVSEYKLRRQKLMDQTRDGIVVLIGNLDEGNGIDTKFRQNDNFLYLTGVETPGAYLILVPDGYQGAKELLFIPPRNPNQERWTGPQIGPGEEAARLFNVDRVLSSSDFYRVLYDITNAEFRNDWKKLYTIDFGNGAKFTREREFTDTLRQTLYNLQIVDVTSKIGEMRRIKTAPEIALLQKAIEITGEAQRDAAQRLAPGRYEFELEALIIGAFLRQGAERAGFPCIVGSGVYSTILHYNKNRKQIDDGDTVVIDIGAEYSQYTADITRTYPANGKFTKRQRELYELVLAAQTEATKDFKPGQTTINDLNRVVRDFFHKSPLRGGNNLPMDYFFIHGLTHYLGMNVHDVGDISAPLAPGTVITIEPGLYIPDEKIGIRIEDDYLVTEKGLEKLSKSIPSQPDEIERLMAENPK